MKEVPCGSRTALVDDEDFALISAHSWRAYVFGKNNIYACACGPKSTLYMHRLIMSPPAGMEVDHINGDGLDNRRSNLRICTHAQNLANQHNQNRGYSRYKGVTFNLRGAHHKKPWMAQIKVLQQRKYIGYFATEAEAARAYNAAALLYFGEFASLNDVPDEKSAPMFLEVATAAIR